MHKQLLLMLLLLIPVLASTKSKPAGHSAKPQPAKEEAAEPDVYVPLVPLTPEAQTLLALAAEYEARFQSYQLNEMSRQYKGREFSICGRVSSRFETGDAIKLKCLNKAYPKFEVAVFFHNDQACLDYRVGQIVTLKAELRTICLNDCIIFSAK
jgi:hypothetical protein